MTVREKIDYQEIPIDSIHIDPSYYRSLNYTRVRDWKTNQWDAIAAGSIAISFRPDGYYLLDGQHRIELARQVGRTHVLALVYYGLSYREEITHFLRMNGSRSQPSPIDRFRARLAEGDESALAVQEIATRYGFRFSTWHGSSTLADARVLEAVSLVERVYRMGVLDKVLRTITESWPGNATAKIGSFLRALGWTYSRFPQIEIPEFVERLQTQVPDVLIGRARTDAHRYRTTVDRELLVAFTGIYNQGRRGSRRLEVAQRRSSEGLRNNERELIVEMLNRGSTLAETAQGLGLAVELIRGVARDNKVQMMKDN